MVGADGAAVNLGEFRTAARFDESVAVSGTRTAIESS